MSYPRVKRLISRNKFRGWQRIIALILSMAGLLCFGEEEAEDIHIKAHEPDPVPAGILNEISSYARLAREAADKEKWPLADHFLELLVNLPAPETAKKQALREIGETYEKQHAYGKAVAIFEKMAELYSKDPDAPELLLKVGLLYRNLGAHQRAISRFYSVLNAALKVNARGLDAYKGVTQRAQIEIAETYLVAGDYAQASKFLNLLIRLDLAPADKARVYFKTAHCHFLQGDLARSVELGQRFLAEFPDDASAPECRYLVAKALRAQRRPEESFEVVLSLLRVEKQRKEKAPEQWIYWQKLTGNEFANTYYQQGDFVNALTIYQTLARLNQEPEWQWPVVYQMGLCFERLRLSPRAAEAYKFIIDDSAKPERAAQKLSESTLNIVQMARWRGEQIVWNQTTGATLEHLLGEGLAPAPAKPVLEEPAAVR